MTIDLNDNDNYYHHLGGIMLAIVSEIDIPMNIDKTYIPLHFSAKGITDETTNGYHYPCRKSRSL